MAKTNNTSALAQIASLLVQPGVLAQLTALAETPATPTEAPKRGRGRPRKNAETAAKSEGVTDLEAAKQAAGFKTAAEFAAAFSHGRLGRFKHSLNSVISRTKAGKTPDPKDAAVVAALGGKPEQVVALVKAARAAHQATYAAEKGRVPANPEAAALLKAAGVKPTSKPAPETAKRPVGRRPSIERLKALAAADPEFAAQLKAAAG